MTEAAATVHRMSVPKTARWFELGALGPDTLEAWVVCHGYGQLAGRFIASFAPIVTEARAIVAPEALHRFYLDPADKPAAERRVGATWMTREEREQDIADYVAYLERLADAIAERSPRARITALGFSQGGATVSRWAVACDRDLARVILWGSELPPDLDWTRARSRFTAVMPWFVVGERDEFAGADRMDRQRVLLERRGVPHRIVRYPGGHAIDREALIGLSVG